MPPQLTSQPFVLLDDARADGAAPARLYTGARELVIARRPGEVADALARLDELSGAGHALAGYIAYESGLALEPRLTPLAAERTGGAGPLVWFGAFDGYQTLAPDAVPAWLAANAAPAPPPVIGPLDPQLSPGGYAAAFAALQEGIAAGDIYQANLTLRLAGRWHGDPLALYAAIRPAAGAGYGGVIFDGAHWLLSFSPELFVALQGGAALVKPMKGTRPRGRDADDDARLAGELARSVKDRAENLMIVDLLRNDLSRVARPGSVRVSGAFTVESYPTVHQMVSTVRAEIAPGTSATDIVRALFPCGSITGAPKIRAMELIDRAERDARGAYCGAIGRIDPATDDGAGLQDRGGAAFNVAIRTLRLTPEEGGSAGGSGRAVLGVGSAIVADSSAMAEWRECLVKGEFVRRSNTVASAAGFDLIETMAFSPAAGIPLLERHLARLSASAGELGFALDRHALRNAIQALCFDAEEAGRLRLVVARSGAFALEIGPAPTLAAMLTCAVFALPVDAGDFRLRHKTSDRAFYDAARRAAQGAGADEALLIGDDGLLTEGSFTNLFVERGGMLVTPPAALGLLPGVLRAALIADGRAHEGALRLADLAGGFLVGNALRGLIPARLLGT